MGNFEKFVVLLILLVCVIVLSISLRSPEVEASTTGPALSSALEVDGTPLRETIADRQAPAPSVRAPSPEPSNLRSSLDGRTASADTRATSAPESVQEPAPIDPLLSSLVEVSGGKPLALVSTKGLRETVSPEYMLYTCREGENWLALAQRFYGDAKHAHLLINANETLEEAVAGEPILVPAYALVAKTEAREPAQPRPEVPKDEAGRTYTVQSGDSLSSISNKLYGTGGRWMQIYDANRGILDDPNSLKVGQTLQIP